METLRAALGERVSTNPGVCEVHGRDENYAEARSPLAVVFAESVADVQATLAWARANRTPVIPFGAGTSLEGHLVPQGDAVSLDLSRMNRVIEVRPGDFLATVEPGLSRVALNAALRDRGLFFPVDPGADASLGGMAATNASGTTTVRYGGMRPNVAALEVVLASGEVLRLGRPVRKTSSGYDLKDLFIGSGGTLGIITQLTLHLHPVPAQVRTLRLFFPDLASAVNAAHAILATGAPVARLELLDRLSLRAINQVLGRRYPEQPALFVEFHASTVEAIAVEVAQARQIAHDAGATDIAVAATEEERLAQWEARHRLYWAMKSRYPGRPFLITDTAVPLSRVAELVEETERLLLELKLDGSILGHVGDGNFHTLVAIMPENEAAVHTFATRLIERALALGGTASGEHGIGLAKKPYMLAEHGGAVAWMQRIKVLFDPAGLLNPGKIV